MDARIWKSESDGQHPDADVQRQLWEDTDVKLRAMVKRGVRRNMTSDRRVRSGCGEFEEISAIIRCILLAILLSVGSRVQSPGAMNVLERSQHCLP